MFCPSCKDEFVPGIKECPDCHVPLVDSKPPEEKQQGSDFVELVTVKVCRDLAELLVAKSVLDGAGIRYFARGEHLQNILGVGSFGGFNMLTGPVELQVPKDMAGDAKALLEEI